MDQRGRRAARAGERPGAGRPVVVLSACGPLPGLRAAGRHAEPLMASTRRRLPHRVADPGILQQPRVYSFVGKIGNSCTGATSCSRTRLDRSEGAFMKIGEIFETKIEEKIEPVIKVGGSGRSEARLRDRLLRRNPDHRKVPRRVLEHYTDTFRLQSTEIGCWIPAISVPGNPTGQDSLARGRKPDAEGFQGEQAP